MDQLRSDQRDEIHPVPGSWTYGNVIEQTALNTGTQNDDPTLNAAMTLIYYEQRNGVVPLIFAATRGKVGDAWSVPQQVTSLEPAAAAPELSSDGLALIYTGYIVYDLKLVTRPGLAAAWQAPVVLEDLNTASDEETSSITLDRMLIVFDSTRDSRAGIRELHQASRKSASDPWGAFVKIASPNPTEHTHGPWINDAGTVLFFTATAQGSAYDSIWVATRPDRLSAFSVAQQVQGLSAPATDVMDPWVSQDYRTLFFVRRSQGVERIFQATLIAQP